MEEYLRNVCEEQRLSEVMCGPRPQTHSAVAAKVNRKNLWYRLALLRLDSISSVEPTVCTKGIHRSRCRSCSLELLGSPGEGLVGLCLQLEPMAESRPQMRRPILVSSIYILPVNFLVSHSHSYSRSLQMGYLEKESIPATSYHMAAQDKNFLVGSLVPFPSH